MTWFQIWTVSWQVAVFLTPLLVGCAVLWLKAQFVTKADAIVERNRVDGVVAAVRQDMRTETNRLDVELGRQKDERDARYERVRDTLADHDARIKAAETDLARPPSRHTLNNAIAAVQGGQRAVEKSVEDMRRQMEAQGASFDRQMETLGGYLHTLIEKRIS